MYLYISLLSHPLQPLISSSFISIQGLLGEKGQVQVLQAHIVSSALSAGEGLNLSLFQVAQYLFFSSSYLCKKLNRV